MLLLQAFLFSALRNLGDAYHRPYPAALVPGQKPLTILEFNAARAKAQAALMTPRGRMEVYPSDFSILRDDPAESSQQNTARPQKRHREPDVLTFGQLHLTARLAPSVFLGRYGVPYFFYLLLAYLLKKSAASWYGCSTF